ncbi:multidrug ABC transporter permease/ATP-binding protein (plasmid) [Moraxella atlantae]|uniref:multidrug ABC transporter permease/ATP-binding protein n=1 Tax=Faucicola atlantae TaxID=34059 RepID=UPI00375176FB
MSNNIEIKTTPDSSIWRLIWQSHRMAFVKVIALNLLNALVGVLTIAYINQALLSGKSLSWQSLAVFLGLIFALLATTFISQFALTKLGHQFVLELRQKIVKQILDSDISQTQAIGSAKLLASLSTDIQAITTAFVRLPELIQGVILCGGAGLYLGFLSLPLLLIVAVWIMLTIVVSGKLVNHVYAYLEKIRHTNDQLYQDYQAVIDGQAELKLHRPRAKCLYQSFANHTETFRNDIVKADTFHLSAVNWSNIMMFASIGIVLVLSQLWSLASLPVAITFGVTLLFLKIPLLSAVGAYPTLQSAQVALDKIQSLGLAQYQADFAVNLGKFYDWQQLHFEQIGYTYPNNQYAQKFALSPLNFTLQRGEVVFLIGSNGSGKTTFAKLITGIYLPTQGQLFVEMANGEKMAIDDSQLSDYRQLFSAIFSDFHLFDTLMNDKGEKPDDDLVNAWLAKLQISHKTQIINHQIQDTQLSQGQKKRLAMLLAVADSKPIMLLDEWAADQDPSFRRYFYHELIPMLKSMGKTLFVISHDDNYFEAADRLLMMKNGILTELQGDARTQATHDAISAIS